MSPVPLEVFTDLAQGTVTSGGTTAPAAGTAETWTVTAVTAFPAAAAGATQFHVADPVLNSEIIAVTACPGGTGAGQSWTVTRGAEGTVPVPHSGGFTVVQVTTSAGLTAMQYKPWQFLPEAYGARGDGIIGTGGTGTSGTSTFTDAGAHFVNAPVASGGDVGKLIVINQGTSGAGTQNGTTQNPFCGTITAVGSATSVTLSGNLAAPCASAPYIYGTDDQPAIQACLTAAGTWAAANGQDAEILLGSRAYMLGALTRQSSPKVNTHLAVPYGTQTGQRLVIRVRGLGAPQIEYWESTVPHLNGPCLVSAVFATGQPDATFGQVSIIGGPSAQLGAGQFANVRLEIDGVSLVAPWNSQMYGADGRWIAQQIVPAGLFMGFVPVNVGGASIGGPYAQNVPSNGIAVGFAYPWASNNAANFGGMVSGESVPYAVAVSEHTTFTRLTGLYNTSACYITSAPSVPHALTIQHLCAEGSGNALDASDGGLSGGTLPVNIGMIETEGMTNSIVNDPNNVLTGIIRAGAGGASTVTVIGGSRVIVLDDQLHNPGPWSGAPSAPSSGTAQQNLSYRYATIYARAVTSITSIAIGPTSGSMTSATVNAAAGVAIPVRVPPGWFWSATYSGTLTAPWWLD
jgi:hypothetical protein